MSTASSSCRIDWRPSRLLCAALLVLGMLAAAGALLSGLPLAWKLPLAVVAAGQGARLAWLEWHRLPCTLELEADGRAAMHGLTLASPRLRLRGPLACLGWRGEDGRGAVLLWCADTLPAPSRRQLLLRLGGRSLE